MCHMSWSPPVTVPLAATPRGGGFVELEYTLALAKVTTLRDGVHRSTNSLSPFPYPLDQGWVPDPDFEPGSHSKCLHFATPEEAIRGDLDDYGSHRLITLPTWAVYGRNWGSGRCWHDHATLPVCCLACDLGDDPSALNTPEFWTDVRRGA